MKMRQVPVPSPKARCPEGYPRANGFVLKKKKKINKEGASPSKASATGKRQAPWVYAKLVHCPKEEPSRVTKCSEQTGSSRSRPSHGSRAHGACLRPRAGAAWPTPPPCPGCVSGTPKRWRSPRWSSEYV